MTVTLSEDLNPIQLRFRSFLGWDRKECCASASAEAALAEARATLRSAIVDVASLTDALRSAGKLVVKKKTIKGKNRS